MLKDAWSICWRNDNVDKQPGKSFLLHWPTAHKAWPMYPGDSLPCKWSHYFQHLSKPGWYEHHKTNPLQTSRFSSLVPTLSVALILPLSFSQFHYVSFCFFYPSQFSLLSPPSSLRLSFRIVEKWRIDWMSVSLWEMSLLMWRTGLVPYSSVSLWITVRL